MRDFTEILAPILTATTQALAAAGAPVQLSVLTPGADVAWDNCCEDGGMTYLRVMEVYPTSGVGGAAFPNRDNVQRGPGCGITLLAFRLGLGVIRCAHTIDSQGTPPSADEMSADADQMLTDMSLLLDLISCVLPDLRGIDRLSVNGWTPQGPTGGCVGGEWDFYVAIDPCLDCNDPPAPFVRKFNG